MSLQRHTEQKAVAGLQLKLKLQLIQVWNSPDCNKLVILRNHSSSTASILFTAQSISAFLITRGGVKRIT